MSAAMQSSLDPTRGMSLVSNVNPDRELPRYLFLAGQLLDPGRVAQMEHIRDAGGGEEVQTHCFRRTTGGFLPRGHLTPMETWVDHQPAVLIGEGLESETVHIQGPMTAQTLGVNRPGMLLGKPLSNVKFYPGDEINSILRADQNRGQCGIVEVKALKGVAWYEDTAETRPGVPQILNRDFFPTPPPPTLRGLREAIQRAAVLSPLHEEVAKDMLASCTRFETYANGVLAVEHGLLRERKSHQHTYAYSPVAREFLRQLEMKPQDAIMEQSFGQYGDLVAALAAQQGGGMTPANIGAIVREVIAAMNSGTAQADQNKPASDTEDSDATPEQGELPPVIFDASTPDKGTVIRAQDGEVARVNDQSETAPEGQPVPRRKKNTEG